MEGTHRYQYRQGGENICQTTCFSCRSAIFVGDDSVEKTEEGFGFMDRTTNYSTHENDSQP